MAYSENQNKWTQAYIKKNYDDIKIRVPKGDKEKYKIQAMIRGTSLNKLVIKLLERDIECATMGLADNELDIVNKALMVITPDMFEKLSEEDKVKVLDARVMLTEKRSKRNEYNQQGF